jgi:L-2-hydroxyglutarate oxidase
VLHSGVYYQPGSLKALNCREGKRAMEEFCAAEGLPFEICGKVIVAVRDSQLPALHLLHQRGRANGVRCELIGPSRLAELEPHAAGVQALHVPEAGIVDYGQVCQRLAARIVQTGEHRLVYSARVRRITRSAAGRTLVETDADEFDVVQVVNCAGLHSDRVCALTGQKPEVKIVPFRGEYYRLRPGSHHLVNHLIYPVPDPAHPFLGVHFTRMIQGTVECGPNAVLALGREAYGKLEVNFRDLVESLTYPGFIRLAAAHWRVGAAEIWRSLSKRAFVRALQRLVPEIRADDLEPAPAGIRAQAVRPQGGMVDDFMLQEADGALNVCNAPSPAATASLNIGKLIADKVAARF